jgi:hypothetical protein
MKDPRADNCRQFAQANGKVTGVDLTYLPAATTTYELVKVSLVDEETAQGQIVATITVLDRDGLPAQVNCYLAWPWQEWRFPARFENFALPGNANVPYQHMITNKYDPAEQGPLAIFIGDKQGNVLSDVIGGLGLPAARHVSYQLVFRERSDQTENPDPGTEPAGNLAAQLQRIEAKLDRIAKHFGLEV